MPKMNKCPKLLLVGGNFSDIPLIISAQELGYYVITTGNRPDDPGHNYSDQHVSEDFSDCKAIFNLAQKLDIAAICSGCNDFAALSAAYTAEKLNLPGHDSFDISQIIHHKDSYREFAQKNNIPTPKTFNFKKLQDAQKEIIHFPYPVIIKPVDLTGGKGISVASNQKKAEIAVKKAFNASKAKRIVVEEFIEGTKHGYSAFLVNQKVVFSFFDNEYYHLSPYLVSAAAAPGSVSQEVQSNLTIQSEKIASLLKLKDGIFHVQFILTSDQNPIIIEICRRAPGDRYIDLVTYATKVNYPKWIVKAASGKDCSALRPKQISNNIVRHCIMSYNHGSVKKLSYYHNIEKYIFKKHLWWNKGMKITDPLVEKLGILFLKFDTYEEMLRITPQLQDIIKVELESGDSNGI